jgi:hypothetical protein
MHVNEVLHRTWNMFVSPNSTLLAWSRLFGRGTLGDKYPESSSRGPSVSARPRFRHARMIRKRHGTRRAMHYSILTKSPRHSRPATAARRPPRDDVPPPSPTHPPPHPLQTPPDRDDDDADGRGRPLELDSRGWGPRAGWLPRRTWWRGAAESGDFSPTSSITARGPRGGSTRACAPVHATYSLINHVDPPCRANWHAKWKFGRGCDCDVLVATMMSTASTSIPVKKEKKRASTATAAAALRQAFDGSLARSSYSPARG